MQPNTVLAEACGVRRDGGLPERWQVAAGGMPLKITQAPGGPPRSIFYTKRITKEIIRMVRQSIHSHAGRGLLHGSFLGPIWGALCDKAMYKGRRYNRPFIVVGQLLFCMAVLVMDFAKVYWRAQLRAMEPERRFIYCISDSPYRRKI